MAQNKDVRESLYLHVNNRYLLSGDQLYFTAFLRSDFSKQLTENSKILYVELVGKDGVAKQKKIWLEGGTGSSSFFIDSNLKTGQYYLVAHTSWMKNFDDQVIIPLRIVNPYRADEELAKVQESKLKVRTIFQNDNVINGLENSLLLSTENAENNRLVEASLSTTEGDIIFSTSFDNKNHQLVQFSPEKNQTYRWIITDENGRKTFQPIEPIDSLVAYTEVSNENKQYKIKLKTNYKDNAHNFKLKIRTAQEAITSFNINAANPITIDEKTLKTGLNFIDLYDQNQFLFQTYILKEEESKQRIDTLNIKYEKRANVVYDLRLDKGTYSVSVKRAYKHTDLKSYSAVTNEIVYNLSNSSAESDEVYLNNDLKNFYIKRFIDDKYRSEVNYLPETRNEILSGKINSEKSGFTKNLYLSFPQDNYQLVTSKVQNDGHFFFHFIPPATPSIAYIGSLDTTSDFNFSIDKKFVANTLDLQYPDIRVSKESLKEIENRSIHIQIQNAYFENLTDTLQISKWYKPFANYTFEYLMADYKEFNTLKEHITEYIQGVKVRNNKVILTQKNYGRDQFNNQLLLIDGVVIDPEKILEIKPAKIKEIKTKWGLVFINHHVFNGILEIITHDKDLGGLIPDNVITMPIEATHESSFVLGNLLNGDANEPLLKDQLLWNTYKHKEDGLLKIRFNTNDLSGFFKLEIEGFTQDGNPTSIIKYFYVEE